MPVVIAMAIIAAVAIVVSRLVGAITFLDDLVEFSPVEPNASALGAVVDLDTAALGHLEPVSVCWAVHRALYSVIRWCDCFRYSVASGPVAEPDDLFVRRLGGVCARVSEAEEDLRDAGADWWPLAMVWRHEGRDPVSAVPEVVAKPESAAEVAAVLALCSSERVPVTAFGGRSGVCGGSLPVHGGVALDLTGLDGIEEVDHESLLVTVGAGTNGREFENALQAAHGLTVGHWPQSIDLATVGGWIACRGAGQYSTRYGTIADLVEGLEVALADGSIIRTGWCGPRAAMGPDLTQLFVGSEGTLGVITAARLRAHRVPTEGFQGAYGYESFTKGLEVCRRIMRRGATPAVLRLYDKVETRRHFDELYETERLCVLLVHDEGDEHSVEGVKRIIEEETAGAKQLDAALVDHWMKHRNDVSGLGKAVEAGLVVDTCEIAAPWSAVPRLSLAPAMIREIEGTVAASVHASHHYVDGACLYITFAGKSEEPDRWYRGVWDALMATTLAAGGSISHHHGIGLVRGRFMAEALGPAFEVLESLKTALDPAGVLNPGKLGLPSPFGPPVWP